MTEHERRADECWEIANLTMAKDAGLWAVAAGLFAIASAQAYAARHLGNGDAVTQYGALEALGKHIGESLDGIATALHDIGDK
jgi:hypothetical protein